MGVEFEHDTINNKFYLHDFIDGWETLELTENEYKRFTKQGFISVEEKNKLINKRGFL